MPLKQMAESAAYYVKGATGLAHNLREQVSFSPFILGIGRKTEDELSDGITVRTTRPGRDHV